MQRSQACSGRQRTRCKRQGTREQAGERLFGFAPALTPMWNNNPAMITILGSGGAIANELSRLLVARGMPYRLVSRKGAATACAAETVAANVSDRDQAILAVADSSIVFLLVGLKYHHRVWEETWPRIMANTIEACKRAGARLVFFDNVTCMDWYVAPWQRRRRTGQLAARARCARGSQQPCRMPGSQATSLQ